MTTKVEMTTRLTILRLHHMLKVLTYHQYLVMVTTKRGTLLHHKIPPQRGSLLHHETTPPRGS